ITDEKGGPIPCKIACKGKGETSSRNWGPPSARQAVVNLFCSENGRFTVPIKPGSYEATVSNGPEYAVERVPLTVTKGKSAPLKHHNAFPQKMKPRTQDNGAPTFDPDPAKLIRRLAGWDDNAEKLVQQNHPDIGWLFLDKDGDGKSSVGYKDGFAFMNVIEVH